MKERDFALDSEKNDAIKKMRSFAHDIIQIAQKRDVPPPATAEVIAQATYKEFFDAQYRGPLKPEDILYWQAVINQEYNEAIDERYGPRPAPQGGIPLPPSPLERRYQKWFDANS